MNGKLTPRAGDRVLVSAGQACDHCSQKRTIPSTTAVVLKPIGDMWATRLDQFGHQPAGETTGKLDVFYVERLTVVDREPVEWPQGWAWGSPTTAIYASRAYSRFELQDILATGPAMLRDWDELMGGDA
jgi:hypothetical protein